MIELYNPLSAALGHYTLALRSMLVQKWGCLTSGSGVETADGPLLLRAGQQALDRLHSRRSTALLIVVWPAFGRFDAVTWLSAARRRPVWLVVHDPHPLRAQRGHSWLARHLEALARPSNLRVVAHSEPAAAALREMGWEPQTLPHPVMPSTPEVEAKAAGGPVVVLGQFKPTRASAPLRVLAEARRLDGLREVHGRGWPPIEGWQVNDQFLSEVQFDAVLGRARCLVVPYLRYFQSGVAVRALEAGTPVVAERHPFLEALLGVDWPGFVRGGAWDEAVSRVETLTPDILGLSATRAREESIIAWHQAIELAGIAGRDP